MWCHLSGFGPEEAQRALLEKHGEQSDFAKEVHRALCRDMPEGYAKLFPQNAGSATHRKFTCATIPNTSEMEMSIKYNPEKHLMVATFKGYEDHTGWGISFGSAAANAERLWWIQKSILRIQSLIDQ